jgi:lipopolysaccharide export system protein LptA
MLPARWKNDMKKSFALPAAIFCFVLLAQTAFAGKPISFSADRLNGSAGKKNESTTLSGNAVVTVGSLKISGDLIELSGKDYRYVKASGNIKGGDSEKGYSFTADEISYDRDTEVASFRGNAKLIDTKHEVEASAGIITYNQKTEVAYLQLDIKLKKNKINCTSGFALYRRTLSMLDLSGSPFVVRDGDEFRADRISVNLDTEHITLDGTVTGTLKKTDDKNVEVAGEAKPADGAKPSGEAKPAVDAGATKDGQS